MPTHAKKKSSEANTLGSPVGMVQSSYTMSTADLQVSELQPQRFATILKTLARVYMQPEVSWTSDTVDQIMQEGQKLYMLSQEDPPNVPIYSAIYNDYEKRINREFNYDPLIFRIELKAKFSLNPVQMDYDDDRTLPDGSIDELPNTLSAFFESSVVKYALVMLNDWYLMIWHSQGVFFVADYYGRNKSTFVSDREEGVAMVIALREIQNVIYLIMNLSKLRPQESTFNLREMRVVKLTTPDGRTQTRDYAKRINEWTIIHDNYAFLKATLHLSLNPMDPVRNRSALTTAVGALLASKIDHPATWTGRQLDKLMCFGVTVCRCCWVPCLDNFDPIQIEEFPRSLKLGQFFIKYDITPRIVSSIWQSVPNYRQSALTTAIQELFESGYNKLILQIEHQIYAIFEKEGFIYIFDPFRHRVQGHIDPDNMDDKVATMRMFRSAELFFNVLNQMLLETTKTNRFYIHALRVKRISTTESEANKPFGNDEEDSNYDTISLNEYICYEEDEVRCYELMDISGFGDDDQSLPPELPDLPSSSTVGEEMEEEGEGGLGEMAGVETASTETD